MTQAGDYAAHGHEHRSGQGDSNVFSVTAAAATQLVIDEQPDSILVGAPFTRIVRAVDAFGNTDAKFKGSVALTLASNPSNSTLGGTLTATAARGVATFGNLQIDQPGSGNALAAASSGLAAGSSPPFDVTNSQLEVTIQPPAAVATADSFNVVVTAKNQAGSVDASFNGNVTIGDNLGAAWEEPSPSRPSTASPRSRA